MSAETPPIPNPGRDDASWLLFPLLVVPFLLLQYGDPFVIAARSFTPPVVFLSILGLAALVYRRWRPVPQIVAMVTGLQQMILFSCLGAITSYLIAARGGALWDTRFQAWDSALGLDWLGYLSWVNAHPLIGIAYSAAYASLIPQMIVVIVGLGFAGRQYELRIVVFAAILAGIVTIFLSGATPATSNFTTLALKPADYGNLHPTLGFIAELEHIRAGAQRHIAFDTMQGIITFPSFHAVLATIYAWGFFKTPYLRWPGVALSLATVAATPIDGGHYFVDVIAGIAVAAGCLWIGHRAVKFSARASFGRIRELLPEARFRPVRALPFRRSRESSAL